jgi:hypothetical protein
LARRGSSPGSRRGLSRRSWGCGVFRCTTTSRSMRRTWPRCASAGGCERSERRLPARQSRASRTLGVAPRAVRRCAGAGGRVARVGRPGSGTAWRGGAGTCSLDSALHGGQSAAGGSPPAAPLCRRGRGHCFGSGGSRRSCGGRAGFPWQTEWLGEAGDGAVDGRRGAEGAAGAGGAGGPHQLRGRHPAGAGVGAARRVPLRVRGHRALGHGGVGRPGFPRLQRRPLYVRSSRDSIEVGGGE